MQGPQICRVLLLLVACLWSFGCSSPSVATLTPLEVTVPFTVPLAVEVTREPPPQQTLATPMPAAIPTRAVPCASSHLNDAPVVTIGSILPLSSPGALLAGFAMQTALNIAVTDINNQGGVLGVPIRLITYDSAGIPERGAQFAERLILLDCAVGIVGLYHNNVALAVTDVAHRYGIPVIIAEASSDEITARGYPEVFRIAPSDTMLAQMPAQWLTDIGDYNEDGKIVAAMIADNTNSTSSLLEATRNRLLEAEIPTELLRVDLPSTDFSSVIARLVAHEQLPDAIFIYIKGQPALLLQAELLAAGIGPQSSSLLVQNNVGLNSTQFWADLPNGTGTVVAHTGAWHATLTPRGQEFVIKYDQYMGRWPEAYAFASYDALYLLVDAMRESPSLAGSDLVNALERCDDVLTSGQITFALSSQTAKPASEPTYLWHQWVESQILYLQYTYPNQPADAMPVIWPPHYRPLSDETAVAPAEP